MTAKLSDGSHLPICSIQAGLALHLPQLTEVSVETHENEGFLSTTFRLNKGSLIGVVGHENNIPQHAIIASTNFIFLARAEDTAFEVKSERAARVFSGVATIIPKKATHSFNVPANCYLETNMVVTRASANISKDVQEVLSEPGGSSRLHHNYQLEEVKIPSRR